MNYFKTMIAQLFPQCFELPTTRLCRSPRRTATIPTSTGPMGLPRGNRSAVILDVESRAFTVI